MSGAEAASNLWVSVLFISLHPSICPHSADLSLCSSVCTCGCARHIDLVVCEGWKKKKVLLQQAHHIDMSEVNPSLISLLLLKMERGNKEEERGAYQRDGRPKGKGGDCWPFLATKKKTTKKPYCTTTLIYFTDAVTDASANTCILNY